MFLKNGSHDTADTINEQQDPYNLSIHTLSNGLTLYLSCQDHKPRIETRVVIKAGSAQDPQDSTGAAHIMEHLMFKGSHRIGALENDKEEVVLEDIRQTFEQLREQQKDREQKHLFQKANTLNQLASAFSLPGEYDRILSHLGARGVNAYTSLNETVYKCDIPSIELERWISLEAERFSSPVMRSFLTEIEAIYEEYNQELDDDFSRARDVLLTRLFADHPFGDHSILGRKEHIKAPSLIQIENFRKTWYRPEHMAICLAGEFDRDEALALFEKEWGNWTPEAAPLSSKPLNKANAIKRSERRSLKGADSEFTMTGFRFDGVKSRDYDYLFLLDLILSNSQAGLIDLNLVQKQKILEGGSSLSNAGDYSWFVLYGTPGSGQSLSSVHKLLLKQISLIKKGQFDKRLLSGVSKYLEIEQIQELESNQIVNSFADCFVEGLDWEDYQGRLQRISSISAEDLITFVKKNFKGHYIRVDKKEGEDSSVEMVEKPAITAVEIDYNKESSYFKSFRSRNPGYRNPVFPDYDNILEHGFLSSSIQLTASPNKKNDLFELTFIFPEGKSSSALMPIACDYFPYLGTKALSPEALQKEAFLLGIDLSFQVDLDRSVFSVFGRDEDLPKALSFVKDLIRNGQGTRNSYRKYVQGILKRRRDAMLSKKVLLFGALYSWGLYGPDSPFRDIVSEKALKAGCSEDLTCEVKRLFDLPHHIYYFGKRPLTEIRSLLSDNHPGSGSPQKLRIKRQYEELEAEGNLYFTHHDMVQAEVFRIAPQQTFCQNHLSTISLFNEFFGAGLNSLFFQEIREARGLAYTAYSNISIPDYSDRKHILSSYLGTQADKLPDALAQMEALFSRVPVKDRLFEEARTALLKSQASDRITEAEVFWTWWEARELGIDPHYRSQLFQDLESYDYSRMESYFKESVLPVKNNLLVLGQRDELKLSELPIKGDLYDLSVEELFNHE